MLAARPPVPLASSTAVIASMAYMSILTKFILTVSVILGSTAAGYFVRRARPASEHTSHALMTIVAVVGYPAVGFLSIWRVAPQLAELWLPGLAGVQVLIMAALGLAGGRLLGRDRGERGLFAISVAAGNWGFTMGGFVIYILLGPEGLGRACIYTLMFTPALVFVMYPIARNYTSRPGGGSLGRLMVRSIFDWRSLGLVSSIIALCISTAGVKSPPRLEAYHVLDILMFVFTSMAYFAIGLRLHISHIGPMKNMLVALAVMRFGVNLLIGLGLAQLMLLTAWPVVGLTRKIFLMQSLVPTAVSMVAVANMFGLKPREASVLFVVNSVMYLVLVLPLVLWVFGR